MESHNQARQGDIGVLITRVLGQNCIAGSERVWRNRYPSVSATAGIPHQIDHHRI